MYSMSKNNKLLLLLPVFFFCFVVTCKCIQHTVFCNSIQCSALCVDLYCNVALALHCSTVAARVLPRRVLYRRCVLPLPAVCPSFFPTLPTTRGRC